MNATLNRLGNRLQIGDFHLTVGRFKHFRRAYSAYQNTQQRFHPDSYKTRLQPRAVSSHFGHIIPKEHVHNLKERGVSFGLTLPPTEVAQVYEFACNTPCWEPGFTDEFCADDVQEGRLKGARRAFRGLVQHPEECSVVKAIAQDPVILQIVRNYLRYWPTRLTYHLSWSFASDLPEHKQKEIYPPLNYHYDVAGYNFMTTYFYITDVDAQSGPHIMIERSHNHKPWYTLFSSGANPKLAEQILDYYGRDREQVIKGNAGFGFVQDPSCFHRLSPPKRGRRLLLQVRYA